MFGHKSDNERNLIQLNDKNQNTYGKFKNARTPSKRSMKLHSYQTADHPPTNADQFYVLVGYDRVTNYSLWLKSVSIPDQHPLYPRGISDAPKLKSRSSRPSPVLPADQSPLCTTNSQPIPDTTTLTTLTTLNIGPPRPVCLINTLIHSRLHMNNSSKVM